MKKNLSCFAVILVFILGLGAVLLAGTRSTVGRVYDLAEHKAADPYYQSLTLREQVVGDQRSGVIIWVVGSILAVILLGWLIGQVTPLLKEARLSYKAVRPRRSTSRRPSQAVDHPPTAPAAPILRIMPDGNLSEPDDYEEEGSQGTVG